MTDFTKGLLIILLAIWVTVGGTMHVFATFTVPAYAGVPLVISALALFLTATGIGASYIVDGMLSTYK